MVNDTRTEQEINIEAEPANDPKAFKFSLDRTLHEGGAIHFTSLEDADAAPLAKKIFALEGVQKITVVDSTVTVLADEPGRWPQLAYGVGKGIRAVIQSGDAPIPAGVTGSISKTDAARRKQVQQLLDAEINVAVASHGGQINLVDYSDDVVYLRMAGGCQGCGAANVTLKMGVERMLKEHIPEIREVVDVTDHSAGENPYFEGGK